MKALILIGGLGSRLRPLTCTVPKPMLPVVNIPFLIYQIELIKKHGIREIGLCIAYMPEAFKQYFGSGRKWGVKLHYILEKQLLGTGGAVKNAESFVDQSTLIFNGDVLTDIDLTAFIRFHKKAKAIASIALTKVENPTLYGVVETDKRGKISRFVEKPGLDEVTCNTINAGTYIFEPDVLDYIPHGETYSLEREVFPHLLENKQKLMGYVCEGYWLDIGSWEKYLQAHSDILDNNFRTPVFSRRFSTNIIKGKNTVLGKGIEVFGRIVIGDKSRIADNVHIHGNVCIGRNCSIGRGCIISNSVILDNVKIDDDVRIDRSLIAGKCIIEPNSILREGTVIGQGTLIKQYSHV